ncbi:MAG: vitamin B12 dependent-methionine synthase activation domain-containing protein [Lachnospiraceae bacterium]|nr:vitamin B12 dependent-methionine synthase activation domain-containing protein [Lachnospiraceae bacterium]
MEADRKEVLRYLGYSRKDIPDPKTEGLIEECINELSKAASPKFTYAFCDIEISEGVTKTGFFDIKSRALAISLKGCARAVLFAATLGIEADYIIKKYTKINMPKAVVCQAAATELIEKYCDLACGNIGSELGDGFYLRPRFSPGYGDFDIKHQKDFISVLNCPKKIGVTLTDSMMLLPIKSVTAIMGISSEKCEKGGCEACAKKDCEFRRR